MGKYVNDPRLNSYPNLKQAWYRRGVLKELNGPRRSKATNQRFKEFSLPKKKIGDVAGEILYQ